jgi:hypothetical protein
MNVIFSFFMLNKANKNNCSLWYFEIHARVYDISKYDYALFLSFGFMNHEKGSSNNSSHFQTELANSYAGCIKISNSTLCSLACYRALYIRFIPIKIRGRLYKTLNHFFNHYFVVK